MSALLEPDDDKDTEGGHADEATLASSAFTTASGYVYREYTRQIPNR